MMNDDSSCYYSSFDIRWISPRQTREHRQKSRSSRHHIFLHFSFALSLLLNVTDGPERIQKEKAMDNKHSNSNRNKRSRPEWKTEKEDDDTKNEEEEEVIVSPHTLRLLKLIQEGSSDHAKMACSHLTKVTSDFSPVMLWEILGRLQFLLLSANWRTRHNASMAMEGVASHLPVSDQREFLQCKQTEKQHHWLALTDLQGNMNIILNNGRHLLSSSETDYKEDEEELCQLDEEQTQTDQPDFCQLRILTQRKILASRLGLSGILNQVTRTLQTTVQDLIPTHPLPPKMKKKPKRQEHQTQQKETSIRALLVMEMRQQLSSSQEEVTMVSHRNAQSLLASELIFRMFDPSWYVRHGAVLGILALIRAWHNQSVPLNELGTWPHDILARCLCVLALDRFQDFSAETIAPVREMAGQVVSVIISMAPPKLQKISLEILTTFCRTQEWEVRQGGLIALKYTTLLPQHETEFLTLAYKIAIQRLESDSCDDVQGVAARLLDGLLLVMERKDKDGHWAVSDIVVPLWKCLETARLVSPSINDLVALFASLVGRKDCQLVLFERLSSSGKWDGFQSILQRLNILLTCDYMNVKKAIIKSTGSIVVHLASFCREYEEGDNRQAMNASYCRIMEHVYDLYSVYSCNDEPTANELKLVCQELWFVLVSSSRDILKNDQKHRLELQSYFLLHYFDLQNVRITKERKRSQVKTLSSRALQTRVHVAQAISSFLSMDSEETPEITDMLELCLRAALRSPTTLEFQSACILFHSLFLKKKNIRKNKNISLRIFCEHTLYQIIKNGGEPFCMLVERSKVLESDPGLSDILKRCFACGIEMVKSKGVAGQVAADAVVELWKKTFQSHSLDNSPTGTGVSVDSMRVSVSITGALVAGGHQCFPEKLSPLVRAFMTSIQNERDHSCQFVTCSHLTEMLDLLSGQDKIPKDKIEGYKRTHGKVLKNLCNLVASQVQPGCTAASHVIGLLMDKLSMERAILDLGHAWHMLSPLKFCSIEATRENRMALFLMHSLCDGLQRDKQITAHMIKTYCSSISILGCIAQDQTVRKLSCDLIIKKFCTLDEPLTLSTALPSLMTLLKDNDHDLYRLRSCHLVRDLLNQAPFAICPFVRSLLPLAMSMMTDKFEECAKIAASMFSCLVQVAPLVRKDDNIALSSDRDKDNSALVIDHLIHGKTLPPCELPSLILESLNDSGTILRQYQMEGISWLRFLQTVNLNGALCDSMGLGKTLQALVGVGLSHLDTSCKAKEKTISLIICPSSVIGHWMGEIKRFFPNQKLFRPVALYGTEAKRQELWKRDMKNCNIVVTSYAVLRNEIGELENINWCYCVLDEGHLLKNPKTVTARASRRVKSKHKLILTGTPVQNKVFEIWSTFDFLMPNFLGSSSLFSKEFAKPITKGQYPGASAADVANSMEKLKLLHQQVLPFILRREKEQVLQDLPPKIITTILCEMSPFQTQLYSNFCSGSEAKKSLDSLQKVIESAKNPDSANKKSSKLGADVLKSFLYLRLLCTYPSLVHTGTERWVATERDSIEFSGKLMALSELLRNAGIQRQTDMLTAADNDSSLIYCDSDDDDEMNKNELDEVFKPESFDPSLSSFNESDSKKKSKCLIFAQFTRSLDVVEKLLLQPNMTSDVGYIRLDGRVPLSERSKVVDIFNSDENIRIMLLTTRIGGLGLNLTGADTVIFLEHDWNPHADLQSMDRAHRIGQKRNVNVYRLVASGSIEEKIMKLHEIKLAMSEAIVNTDNSKMYSMGTDRLLDIFQFRSEAGRDGDSSQNLANTLDTLVERYGEEYRDLSELDFMTGFTLNGRKAPSNALNESGVVQNTGTG